MPCPISHLCDQWAKENNEHWTWAGKTEKERDKEKYKRVKHGKVSAVTFL